MNENNLSNQYHSLLLDIVVPFWFKYGIDWKYGGVLSWTLPVAMRPVYRHKEATVSAYFNL